MYRHHLEKLTRTRLDDILLDEGAIDRARLELVQSEQDRTGKLLTDVLVQSGSFDEWELAKLQVNRYGLPFIDVKLYNIRREVMDLIPEILCRKHGFVPLDQFGPTIAIAVWEVPSPEVINEIIETTGCTVFLYVAVRRMVLEVLDEHAKKSGAQRSMQNRLAGSLHGSMIGPPPTVMMPGKPGSAGAASPGAAPTPAPAAAPVAAPAPTPAVALVAPKSVAAEEEDEFPPLEIPAISMKLNASAQSVMGPRRPAIDRFPRPAVPQMAGAQAAAAAPATPKPATPAAQRPGRPAAPVLPGAKPATPPAARPAAPAGGWESIFDVGEDAVRREGTDDSVPTHAPKIQPRPASDPRNPR